MAIQVKRQEILERYRSKARQEVARANRDLASVIPSEEVAKGMVEGMTSAVEKGRLQAEDLLTLRLSVEANKERFLIFMGERFADYKVIGNKINFTSQGDSDRYEVLTKSITDSTKALEDLRSTC